MAEKHRTFVATNVGTSDLTGKFCQPTTVQWTMDTYALGSATARAMMARGGDTWFFIAFDYALGAALERDATAVLTGLGGKVLGSVKHPLGTTDFSTFLLQAQASGAKVVALADTGSDLDQCGQAGRRVRPDAEADPRRAVHSDRRRRFHRTAAAQGLIGDRGRSTGT